MLVYFVSIALQSSLSVNFIFKEAYAEPDELAYYTGLFDMYQFGVSVI